MSIRHEAGVTSFWDMSQAFWDSDLGQSIIDNHSGLYSVIEFFEEADRSVFQKATN
jgi:hypothetical protein